MRHTLLLALLPIAVSASSITVVNLGSLGDGDSVAYGVNASGLAVGWSANSNGAINAFSASGVGSPFDFSSLLAGAESYAYGVNSAGSVAGVYYQNGVSHGAIWTGSSVTDLGAGTFATSINDSGVAVGGNGQAIVYADGQVRALGTLSGGNWSAAYAINTAGEVVGYGEEGSGVFRGFYWTGTTLVSIGTLGGSSSYAMNVSNSGEIVGDASTQSGYLHAFSDSGGIMTDLGTLGGTSSYAYGVNSQGMVVGYSTLANGDTHAFLYENGQMIDLNSLLPQGSGWVLVQGYGINDQGQIVGSGFLNGEPEAFRLNLENQSAVPEPAPWVLFGCGGALIGLSVWMRRKTARAED